MRVPPTGEPATVFSPERIAPGRAMTPWRTRLGRNTFRVVNVALVNEIAIMADKPGIDGWEGIEAAAPNSCTQAPTHRQHLSTLVLLADPAGRW